MTTNEEAIYQCIAALLEVLKDEKLLIDLERKEINKIVFIPDKLVNFVVKDKKETEMYG